MAARRWTSREGRRELRRMLASRAAFWRAAVRLQLERWDRLLILAALDRIQAQRGGRTLRRARAVGALAAQLDMVRRYEIGIEVYNRLSDDIGFRGNHAHLVRLLAATSPFGTESLWNRWRQRSQVRPDLRGAPLGGIDAGSLDLRRARLQEASFGNARLEFAQLEFADLRGAWLQGCFADSVRLRGADLRRANLRFGLFTDADLRQADLRGAHLIGTMLSRANVQGAKLGGALVWGVSTWDLEGEPAPHGSLQVLTGVHPWDYEGTGEDPSAKAPVRNLEVAHFISLLATTPKVGRLIDAAAERLVLLLGRFRGKERKVLKALRERLPELGYVPLVFDFPELENRDVIETVAILAGLSKFVIANLSRPKSTPLESQLVIPSIAVPFVPIIRATEQPFSMFTSLQRKYSWVLPTVQYRDEAHLLKLLPTRIVDPAARMARSLRRAKHPPAR